MCIRDSDQTELKLNFRNKTGGIQQGKIEIRDNPITMDDAFYFSYTISDNINILGISNESKSSKLQSIYSTDSTFSFNNYSVSQLDYSLIKKSNLVVVNNLDNINSGLSNALKSFIDNGGSLLIIPSNEINFDSYREFLSLLTVNYFTTKDTSKTKVRDINFSHPVYQNVFEGKPDGNINLPIVSMHYSLSSATTSFKNNLLSLKDGSPFLTAYKVGNGTVYLSTVSLGKESSNFSNHALFVPTLYNIALLSQQNLPLFHIIGSNSTIELNRTEKDNVYHIKNEKIDVIPQTRNNNNYTTIFVNSSITDAGNYNLDNNQIKIGLAYNYNRSESELRYYNITQLEELLANNNIKASFLDTNSSNIKTALSELNIGKKYWKYCIILALLFLATEIALIKLFK